VWIALIVSAISYALAFAFPSFCAWFVFFFLIPVFWCTCIGGYALSFWQGFAWGLIFYGIHFYAFALLFIERAQGELRLLAYVFLVVYCALHAGIWFWLMQCCAAYHSNLVWRVACYSGVTTLYFMFMRCVGLWFTGHLLGYPFALPLLPLAQYPQLLYALPFLTAPGLLLFLICMQICAIVGYIKKSAVCGLLTLFFLAPFAYGWLSSAVCLVPAYVATLGYVEPPHGTNLHPLDCAQAINSGIQKLMATTAETRCIIMPEAAYPFVLNEHTYATQMWCNNALLDEVFLLIGAHRTNKELLQNSLFCVTPSSITTHYDKTKKMPFVEYLPALWNQFNFCKTLFLKEKKEFTTTQKVCRDFIKISDDLIFEPLICSDLYFDTPTRYPVRIPLLCAVNDSWFSATYMRTLMYLFAIFKAMQEQRDIVYVGHYYGIWISQCGMSVRI